MTQTQAIAERDMALLDQLNIARQALSTVQSLPQLKDLRDKVAAIAQYTKQRDYSLEIQNTAAEIKLKAERRLGELLKEMDRKHDGRPKKKQYHDDTVSDAPPKLEDLGITKLQSSRWQQEAALPEDAFQSYVEDAKVKGEELTSAAVLRQARPYLPPSTLRKNPWCIEDDVEAFLDLWEKLRPNWQTPVDRSRICGAIRGLLLNLEDAPDSEEFLP